MKLGTVTYPELQTQTDKWDEWIIPGFAGGLCTAFSDMLMENDQFPELTNLLHELDNSVITRGPYRPYFFGGGQDTVMPYTPISFVFTKLGTTEYVVGSWNIGGAGSDTQVKNWTGTAWNATAITSTLADSTVPQFVKFSVNGKEDLIICTGSDTPIRWTGSGAGTNLGLTAPTIGSPSKDSEIASNRGIFLAGSYYYKVTSFYSGTATMYGESGPSAVSGALASTGTVTAPQKLHIHSMPAIPSGATKNYVYRSPVDEPTGPFRYVGYYDTGTAFTDSCPNGEEGEECPIDAGSPPQLIGPCVFQGRLMGGGLSSGTLTNKFVYSAKGQPDYFPALNFVYLQSEYMQAIPFNRNLYIFCKRHIYVVPDGDFDKYPEPALICEKGTSSARSVVDVGSGLVFQGLDNIYFVDFNTQAEDGDFPIPIGEPIKDRVRSISFSSTDYRTNSCACLHKSRYYISMSTDSATVNNSTFVWDVTIGLRLLKAGRYGAWSKMDWAANHLQSYNGTLYSLDNANKYIMEHEYSGTKDARNYAAGSPTYYPIDIAIRTKRLSFGHENARKLLGGASLAVNTSGVSMVVTPELDDGTSSPSQTTSVVWLDDAAVSPIDSGYRSILTTKTAHGYATGDTVTIAGATGDGVVYNGSFRITAVLSTLTFVVPVAYVAYTPATETTVSTRKLGGYSTAVTRTFKSNATSTAIARWDTTAIGTVYWVYEYFGYLMRHMKFMRGLKAKTFSVRVTNSQYDEYGAAVATGSQDTRIVMLKLYYKMTTPAA